MERSTVVDADDDISILSEKPATFFYRRSIRNGSTSTNPILVNEDHYYFDQHEEITHNINNGGDHMETSLLYGKPSFHIKMKPVLVENCFPSTQRTTTRRRIRSRKSKLVAIDLTQDEPVDPIPTTTFMCDICVDEKPISAIFRILGCNHSYCSDCVSNYVASRLQENISNISCPVPGCAGKLEPQHCTSILPRQVFDRWGDALCEALILASEKFYCPFKDCSSLLINDLNDVVGVGGEIIRIEQSECPDCRRLFCAQCKVPWHANVSCMEFQALKKDENSNDDIQLMNLAKKTNG